MAENLSYGQFPLIPIASSNDAFRPGTLLLEYFEASVTTTSDTGDVEVPTNLGAVLGVLSLNYCSEFGSGDYIEGIGTDGVITTGAVTVRYTLSSGGTDGAHTVRGFLVGTKAETNLLNSPV